MCAPVVVVVAELNDFFLMLSAFNFNIDITAPEVRAVKDGGHSPMLVLACTHFFVD
jgi:hypothetical protein